MIYPSEVFKFKPIYYLEEDSLRHVEIDFPAKEEIISFIENPKFFLPHDYFVPYGHSGVQQIKFPFSISFLKAFKHWHVKSKLSGSIRHMQFYEPSHKSKALQITKKIFEQFIEVARKRGASPVIGFFPTCVDLENFARNKFFVYDILLDYLQNMEVKIIDFGREIYRTHPLNFSSLYYNQCNGHFNAKGNRVVAKIANSYLFANKNLH